MSEEYNKLILNKILEEYQAGNKKDSYIKLETYIKENKNDYAALYNFGYMAEQINDIGKAINCYEIVRKKEKHNWRSRFNLYLIYFHKQYYEKSLKILNEVLEIKENFQPALRDKAHIYFHLNKLDLALKFIEQSLLLNMKDYIAWNIQGIIFFKLKKIYEAKESFEKAISLNNLYFPSFNNIGNCFRELNKRDEALNNYQKSASLNPYFIEAINNIGSLLIEIGEFNKGIDELEKALALDSKNSFKNSQINLNLAIGYFFSGDILKAEKYFKVSEKIDPQNDKFKKNYSLFLLYLQRYNEAWKIIDGRLELSAFNAESSIKNKINKKIWKGEDIKENEKILVIKEQGIGDEILYSSMYPDLIKKFPNTVIETENRLLSLFKRSFKNEQIFIPFQSESTQIKEINKYDKVLFSGSLGRLFRNSQNEFPKKSFLNSDTYIKSKLREIINKISSKPKIGIGWKSKREFYGDSKSIDLSSMNKILSIKNLTFINLQYGDVEKELIEFEKKYNNKIFSIEGVDLFNDFEKISALLESLDLFITISNSTAHLAGALGVPTWLIKPKKNAKFHYWNQPNNSTPWYPSVELFSQDNKEELVRIIEQRLIEKFNLNL